MVLGTGTDPTHHLVLSDGFTEVGMILTNAGGDREERVLRRFPVADPAQPYSKETQNDWSGGMAGENFEDDRSKYWESKGVDAMHSGALVLGPLFRYAKGYRKAAMYQPVGEIYWTWLFIDWSKVAVKFTPDQTFTPTIIKFWYKTVGTPTGNLTVSVRSDNGGNPGTILDWIQLTPTSHLSEDAKYYKAAINPGQLNAGTTYWVEFEGASADDWGNHWRVLAGPTGGTNGKNSRDGTTWSSSNRDYAFRLTEADDPFIARFYEYKGQLYAALQYDDNGTPAIYMNGWRGAADSNLNAMNKLKDSTQTGWASRDMTSTVVRMVAGAGTTELEDWRFVTGSASGELTVSPSWNILQGTASDYVVMGSDEWFAVPSTGLTKVTDVGVADGIVFFCQGPIDSVLLHREANISGTWTADTSANCWRTTNVKAHFVKPMIDPLTGTTLWFGLNHNMLDRDRPIVWKSKAPVDWGVNLAFNRTLITEIGTAWTGATSDISVSAEPFPSSIMTISVFIGRVTAINATPTAAGSGYTVNDVLTINQTGSSLTATVRVTTVNGSGGVTALTLLTAGYDYTVGSGKATTGGTGTGCTVEITTISSFSTGVVAYYNLGSTVDVRYGSRIRTEISVTQPVGANELTLLLDNSTNVASPVVSVSLPRIDPGSNWTPINVSYDAGNVSGAEAIASIGLQLEAQKTKTFNIYLRYSIAAYDENPPIEVGEEGDNITGLEIYGDPETLWALTETGIGEIRNNIYVPAPLREMRVARHPSNGKAHTVHDVYLITSWRGRLQRYFRQNLEDLGPDFPSGMASARGQVVAVCTYPGRLYVAVDGGPSKPSHVLCLQGRNWYEVFTSEVGDRIRNIYIQAIPGKSDRLWISVGGDIGYVQLAHDPVNLPDDSDYQFAYEGIIENSWVNGQRRDLDKVFKDVTVNTDELIVEAETGYGYRYHRMVARVDVQYLLNVDDGNFKTSGEITQAPFQTFDIATGTPPSREEMTGRRIRTRLRIKPNQTDASPIIRGVTTRMYTVPEVKYGYSWLTKVTSLSINMRGDEEKALGSFDTVQAALDQLDTWANTLTPLTIKTDLVLIKDKTVILEPSPGQLLRTVPDERLEEDVMQIVVNDI